jgi:hypothetical protein
MPTRIVFGTEPDANSAIGPVRSSVNEDAIVVYENIDDVAHQLGTARGYVQLDRKWASEHEKVFVNPQQVRYLGDVVDPT